jgi:2-polyprenyl-3-methyl-5-hydroxy-6-metoxy-1,4-benzoquinol methylase
MEEVMGQIKTAMLAGKSDTAREMYSWQGQSDQKWDPTVEPPIRSHRKILGPFIVIGKKIVRKCLRWYINPPWEQQKEFNLGISGSIDSLANYHEMEMYRAGLKLKKIEKELFQKNSQLRPDRMHLDLNYFQFEQQFRGPRELIKEKQRQYVDYFKGKHNVIDVGCGRGEFVELLVENGVNVTGIDITDDMVRFCREKGLPVIKEDVFEHLNDMAGDEIDGIFASQVIEHLTPELLIRLIRLAYTKLKQRGVFVLETVNPRSFVAMANAFYIDMSHVKPVHPLTLQFILEAEGFKNIRIVYTSPVVDMKIPRLDIGGTNGNLEEFNRSMDMLNQFLFAPQDYAIVCEK